jgi:ferritin
MTGISDKLLADLGNMLHDEYMACNVDYYKIVDELYTAGLANYADFLKENIKDECKHFMRVKKTLTDVLERSAYDV